MNMSRKNAATLSSTSQQPHHYYTAPKSRSENFVDYMKSTGYKLPKHFNPSHCDFLFNDTELFDCAKFLMGRVTHTVEEEEMARFQSLIRDGKVLPKKELDHALVAIRESELQIAERLESLKKREQELNAEIDERRSRINQWHHLKSWHQNALELKRIDESHQQYQDDNWKMKTHYLNEELKKQRIILTEELKSLSSDFTQTLVFYKPRNNSVNFINRFPQAETLRSLQNCLNENPEHFLCQSDWSQIKSEERFMTLLRETSENYGTGLVGKSEEVDPFAAEKIADECAEQVKGIERLQYVIVYEFLRKVQLTAEVEKYNMVASVMNELIEKARRIASQDVKIRTRMVTEVQQRIDLLKTKTSLVKQNKLAELSSLKMAELNNQILAIKNLKAVAKTKENNFFGIVSRMLISQRARFEIGIGLMKQEILNNAESLQMIQRYNQQLRTFREIQRFMSPEDEARRLSLVNSNLSAAFCQSGIPLTVLSSSENTWKTLMVMNMKSEIEQIRKTATQEQKATTNKKRLEETFLIASTTWQTLRRSYMEDSSPEAHLIQTLSESNRSIKADLVSSHERMEGRAKDAIEWKRSKCGDINAFLENIQTHP